MLRLLPRCLARPPSLEVYESSLDIESLLRFLSGVMDARGSGTGGWLRDGVLRCFMCCPGDNDVETCLFPTNESLCLRLGRGDRDREAFVDIVETEDKDAERSRLGEAPPTSTSSESRTLLRPLS